MLIKTELMPDSSEVIPYNCSGIPLYVRAAHLSAYYDMCAPCHWHDDIEWIYIINGKMRYYINGKRILLNEGDSLMVNARQMHYGYAFEQQDCYFICILFHPSLFGNNQFFQEQYFSPFIGNNSPEYLHFHAQDTNGQKAGSKLQKIALLKEHKPAAYDLQITGVMIELWGSLIQDGLLSISENSAESHYDLSLQKDMVSFIYQHYSEKISLNDIAAAGHMGRSKCCQIFKHYLQQSPVDFLNAYRLKISCQLLCTTQKSITEIAMLCGFNHLSYFSRFFMECYGCTPREYRILHSDTDSDSKKDCSHS